MIRPHVWSCAGLVAASFLATEVLAASPPPTATIANAQAAGSAFTSEQLEQMVAPIALYPDSLLMQIFMAATYPLEIVEAARWREKNPSLSGAALEAGLVDFDWDPNVKSLCGFPDVLKNLSDNLDWTQDLGDAVLGQQQDLLAAVQRMRSVALESGNLETSPQQIVVQESPTVIVIQPADPEIIYVPTYAPTVVYPGWGFPVWSYPRLYVPPMPGYGAMAFTAGAMWGAAVWGDCDWGRGDIDIDIDRHNEFNAKTSNNINNNIKIDNSKNLNNKSGNKASFQHDSAHRKGVNYRDGATATKYGGSGSGTRVSRDEARGRATQLPSNAGGGRISGTGAASGASTRDVGGRTTTPTNRDIGGRTSASPSNRTGGAGSSAYGGSKNPSRDRAASSRGASSRGTTSYGGKSKGTSGGRSSGGRSGGGRR